MADGYVLGTSIVWFQDSDRPTDTGPTAERLKTLTEQVIGRLGK